ncbi:unnamed protein product [Ilex paraguariensis]|uniref:Uncharacterized protein n=1 Tax=Ilex paraguariensis TaxID=185542 RepID=A0ABC8R5Z9_9AQUA
MFSHRSLTNEVVSHKKDIVEDILLKMVTLGDGLGHVLLKCGIIWNPTPLPQFIHRASSEWKVEILYSISLAVVLQVNFSYFEAGENKQALVKVVACERCAEKLLYKKQKEKEIFKLREEEELRRKRERSESDDMDHEYRRRGKRKGRKESTSAGNLKIEEEENFDKFLEGMFP